MNKTTNAFGYGHSWNIAGKEYAMLISIRSFFFSNFEALHDPSFLSTISVFPTFFRF
jgi:hypothetical protein